MSDGIVVGLLNNVDTITQQFVFDGYQSLVTTYANAIYGMVILSVIVFGYLSLLGIVPLSLVELGRRAIIIGFVLSLALHWNIFSEYVYTLFTVAPSEVASHIIGAIPHAQSSTAAGINSEIEQTFNDGIGYANAIWDRAGHFNLGPDIIGGLMMLVTLLLVVVGLAELIIAKFGLAIYLVLAPLIIPLLLFQTTKSLIFDGWLRHLIGFAFIPIFVTSAMALTVLLMSSETQNLASSISNDSVSLTSTAPYLLYAIICIILLYKASHMAVSLAGGFATTLTNHLNKAAKGIKNAMKLATQPQTKNSNPPTGKKDTADETHSR